MALGGPLPIDGHLAAISAACQPPGATLLLQAPPGAGKTTRVPLELHRSLGQDGTLMMLEPRRLAAKTAAQRLARALGEPVGQRVGYRVRLESRCSTATRVEVVTAGLFLRRLQADPALEGVAVVVVDEFHERQAEVDLALALVRQARQLLRPDLRLVVMSATLDLAPLAEALEQATVISSPGRSWPVAVQHQTPRQDERLERQVLRALDQHWLDQPAPRGTALVFLPGLAEIRRCQAAIAASSWGEHVDCLPLHGQLSLREQEQAISAPAAERDRIVLATAIAESSLTLEGVRLVIDSGLSRRSRFDPGTGMDGLVTVPSSLASAEQRRGRAGRLGPGHCVRLWSAAEQQRRPAFDPPELLEADPLPTCLQLAQWGAGLGDALDWITPPPAVALRDARQVLQQLGALEPDGRISRHGQAMAGLGLHPRLAHMLLQATERGWLHTAADLAVLLSERDPLDREQLGCDLLPRLDWLQRRGNPQLRSLAQELVRQVNQVISTGAQGRPPSTTVNSTSQGAPADAASQSVVAQLLAWAYPERLALGRGRHDGHFLLRNGRGARLPSHDPLAHAPALAIGRLDGQGSEARIQLAVTLPSALLEELARQEGDPQPLVRWDATAERVRCEQQLRLDALVLERRPWPEAPAEAVRQALLVGLQELGLEALPWDSRSRQLLHRLNLAHQHLGAPWPDRTPEHLLADPGHWLSDQLDGVRSRQDLQQIDLPTALWGDLDWSLRQQLDQLLPETLPLPTGRRAALTYSADDAVLAVKLQELFGCQDTPRLLQGRLPVTVHLLSPAGRPAAVTRDLASFWQQGYPEVRRELRGRYPKHPWPDDPSCAQATALTKAAWERQRSG